jgi:hypothetical protein
VLTANGAAASEEVELIVVTPPGADLLPWDRSKCTHGAELRCSGKLGCQVLASALEAFNLAAPANWSALNRCAAARVRRRFGCFRMAFRVWEPQHRGALHMNVVVPAHTPRERASAAAYRHELAELAPRYGFGFVDRKRAVRASLHAARYLAKYLSEEGSKMGIGDLVARGDCPVVIARVSPLLTRKTGCTMRSRRCERGLFLLARDLGCTVEEARAVRVVTSKRGRLRSGRVVSGGRSQLPWDSQCQLAEHDRLSDSAVDAWIEAKSSTRVGTPEQIWPIPPRRPVSGVDYEW